jgi:hypothetical protein
MADIRKLPSQRETWTPGRWKSIKGFGPLDDPDTDPERWCIVAADSDRQYLIATVENGQPGDCVATEGRTARLIASAPDLYRELQSMRDRFRACAKHAGTTGEFLDAATASADAALARARGEV